MKMFKSFFFIPFLALFLISCGGDSKTGNDHSNHSDHQMHQEDASGNVDKSGPEYTSLYICPMHCDGSGSDEPGECPVCGMDYVQNEDI